MRKRLAVLMMAGGLALSMLSGCGDEQDNTVVEKERGKKEDPDKKDKDDKKTDAKKSLKMMLQRRIRTGRVSTQDTGRK